MKKVFIGCGILVALIIAAVVVAAILIGPSLMEGLHNMTAQAERLEAMDEEYPYDASAAFDEQRFRDHLEARRVAFRDILSRIQNLDTQEGSFLDQLKGGMQEVGILDETLAVGLEHARMGPTEFSTYSKVLWATLKRVSGGQGPSELDALRDAYGHLLEEAAKVQFQGEIRPLDELVEGVPHEHTEAAMAIMAANVQLTADAIAAPAGINPMQVENTYLALGVHIAQVKQMGEAFGDDEQEQEAPSADAHPDYQIDDQPVPAVGDG